MASCSVMQRPTTTVQLRGHLEMPEKAKDYAFNAAKLHAWAARNCHDEDTQRVVSSVSGCIRRISFSDFTQALGRSMHTLPKGLDKRAVVLTSEHKSNQWVAEIAKEHHRFNSKYQSLGHDHASDYVAYLDRTTAGKCPKEIVLFDDASFSGNQMTNHVNAIRAKLLEKGVKCTIHVVIPFITNVALHRLQNIPSDGNVAVHVHHDTVLPTIKEQLPPDDFQALDLYSQDYSGVALSNSANLNEDSGITGYYFDHKIPNSQSFILSAFARETMPSISPPYTG